MVWGQIKCGITPNFVNDSEFFAQRNPQIFTKQSMCTEYSRLWGEMEIVNALALCEWEGQGKQKENDVLWEGKYKKYAHEVIGEIVNYVKSLT